MTLLGIGTPLVLASELGVPGTGVERLIGIMAHLGGTIFYEGSAGRNYIDESFFAAPGMRVQYQDYEHPVYAQLHGEFVPYLSVVDLLFNHGPESLSILTRSTQ